MTGGVNGQPEARSERENHKPGQRNRPTDRQRDGQTEGRGVLAGGRKLSD